MHRISTLVVDGMVFVIVLLTGLLYRSWQVSVLATS
jgi:hypothetical protein